MRDSDTPRGGVAATMLGLLRWLRTWATPLGRGRLRAVRRGAHLFQPATVTWADRHPPLFALAAARLAGVAAPRLLSFGCATGEEAFTLARYLPRARVDAIDANPACVARARAAAARLGLDRVRLACADAPDALAAGEAYDAVFCLSVLRHGDLDARRPERCSDLLPFARYAAAVAALDGCVRPGGLLVLWGCHFRFADTPAAARYRVIAVPGMAAQPGPFYGADDRLLPVDADAAFVFLKEGGGGLTLDDGGMRA